MKTVNIVSANLIIYIFLISSTALCQNQLFWADIGQGKIKVMNVDDQSEPKSILEQSFIDYHASDFLNGKIYWSDKGKSLIARSNLDGSNIETIIDNLVKPKGITLGDNGHIYFIDDDKIIKVDTNGANQQIVIDGLAGPTDIVFWNDSLFWTDVSDHQIEVIRVDGTGRKILLTEQYNPIDIEINNGGSQIYWATNNGPLSGIYKSNTDGTNKETILEEKVNGFQIDEQLEYLYWSESVFNTINRYNLIDQSSIRLISEYLPSPKSISLDELNNKIYYSDNRYGGILYKANLSNGNSVTEIISTEVYRPERIEIDTLDNKLYWINKKSGFANDRRADIMRSDLNGQNIEKLISYPDIFNPTGLYLDLSGNSMYWSDPSLGFILRSQLDGSNIDTLIIGLENPSGLTINHENNRIYWCDWGLLKIQSSDMNGQNIEDVITTDISTPVEVAIYYKDSKLYWTDSGNGTINRSNYDGTEIENIITTENTIFNKPNSIHIDQKNNKLYYSIDFSDEKIQRSDMDGTNIEDVVTENISSPRDLFIVNSLISSSSDLNNDIEIMAYPNPTSDFLTIEHDRHSISGLFIWNSTGQIIYDNNNINALSHKVNTVHYPPGVYYATVFIGGAFRNFKFIKARF